MYFIITSRLSFFYQQTSMSNILFITREQHLHMFIHCDNCLMPGSSNRSNALKPASFTCRLYLSIHELFLSPEIKGLNARRFLSLVVSMWSFWKACIFFPQYQLNTKLHVKNIYIPFQHKCNYVASMILQINVSGGTGAARSV